jgi:hypothetical protein
MTDWPAASGAKISDATQSGIDILQNKLILNSGVPGAGETFGMCLQNICREPINISFTGHSLSGALAPTLALLYKQQQGQAGGFNPNYYATISATAFVGATAGNAEFAAYSNSQFANNPVRRIHDINDVVPHAWDKANMEKIKTLYDSAGIYLDDGYKAILDGIIWAVEGNNYTQLNNALLVVLSIDPSQGDTFFAQAGYQYDKSYPLKVLGKDAGEWLIQVVDTYK